MYHYGIQFECNAGKSLANQSKHGISFEEAEALWAVPGVEIEARAEGEKRYLRIGRRNDKFYSCVYTLRAGVIRLISCRRSREDEENIYLERIKDEKEKNQGE